MKIITKEMSEEIRKNAPKWIDLFAAGYKEYSKDHPGLKMPEYRSEIGKDFEKLQNAICKVANDPDAPGTTLEEAGAESFKLFKYLKGKKTIKITFHGENKGERFHVKNELLIAIMEDCSKKFISERKVGRPSENLSKLVSKNHDTIKTLRELHVPDEFIALFISKAVYRLSASKLGLNFNFDIEITGVVSATIEALNNHMKPSRTKYPSK